MPDITVAPPKDDHLRHVIDTMALYVLDGGCSFEEAIMERGRGNPLFSFLFDSGSKEHAYYVWRLYSFAQVHFVTIFIPLCNNDILITVRATCWHNGMAFLSFPVIC